MRILFGILMMIDAVNERGLSVADVRWGDASECRFPFLPGLKPLPLHWMCFVYVLLLAGKPFEIRTSLSQHSLPTLSGAAGIALGAYFTLSCALYLSCYWYLLLLEKSYWNNHSYLFGLLAGMLAASEANKLWLGCASAISRHV